MTNPHMTPLTFDALATTRAMPLDLIAAIPILMVNRVGNTREAYMTTENFIGHCEPEKTYRVTIEEGFVPAKGDLKPSPNPVQPPHLVLDGDWREAIDYLNADSNILGGNGRYIPKNSEEALVIPIAETTSEHLAYYGSTLVKSGELVRFDTPDNLPATVTSVGADYPEHYLLQENLGGGAYLEVHDRPHFHMPLNPDNGGYLLIGKQGDDNVRRISAFRIPYGYGIHIGPWAIHSDSYIVGRHLVIYSITPKFSTVILRGDDQRILPIRFVE